MEHPQAETFQEHRPRLLAIASRLLGPSGEAEDAVQEAWLRLSQADVDGIRNLGAWLTTVVSRLCLDALRKRKTRAEDELTVETLDRLDTGRDGNPETEALLDESVGLAMALVLERLSPGERVAFVLHDLFALPFADIAPILGRSEESVRQLASRGRKRVQGAQAGPGRPDFNRDLVLAFLTASRQGDFSTLIQLLDPQVVLKADPMAVEAAVKAQGQGAPLLEPEVAGAAAVAGAFKGRAVGAVPVLLDGAPGAAWIVGKETRAIFVFGCRGGRIISIEIHMDPARLAKTNLQRLD
ncbi:MAG TPA: sigma-70 family RNA polymerase sigma factor [bacterium]|nr:sigma-70 family RNA polymerase sigma factor [bacterium]